VTAQVSFWQVARTARWVGALLLSLALAAGFAWLGQWQIERTFVPGVPVALPIEKVSVTPDPSQVFIVKNRYQADQNGYWVICNSTTEQGSSLTLALGWAKDLATAEQVREKTQQSVQIQALRSFSGLKLSPEAPERTRDSSDYVLETLSPAQLVNLYSPDRPIASESYFFALASQADIAAITTSSDLEAIYIEPGKGGTDINWLTAFYAIEWIAFSYFAVFLWWRLVRDDQIRINGER
jgi:cytochrome oxidase assembly protein ShyY1